ncbi:glycoside hydrolase family 3 C-terminal domain-containing protein [Pararhizobium sp. BT-229]|uniref:beta-glucosidase family protein n=1 Tax=Pararhizobium sp. BT-229 TaxID=2986923 RepID=UPI0021F78542|nr:glycoside hydrolase family 3 C-terminal domain-containing protein [Pararhizobium sp. BT-229]MCV9967017.1 glycoside hydrolase family 3 C-terminal domain-containing protein [Pararhizobium sp. BT-229]
MFQYTHDEMALLVDQMTAAEKADLLSGRGLWKTASIERLGIPSILMTDGAYGVRYSTTQIGAGDSDDNSLQGFLALVNQQAEEAGNMFGATRPATCFPNGNLLGCSWDVDLAYRMGAALAAECQHFGVHLLLGPGINTRRTPLAGRAYEYYSEDPVINGDLAAALIRGMQDNGVGASLKHFACNNSEIERTTTSSDVDERALREIYLAGFERAIEKGKPWTVMSAYNPVNGIHATQNSWLLTAVLRHGWGYDGLVLSDWHAIRDRPASLAAGTDLDMPESKPRKAQLLAATEAGRIDWETINASCVRVLDLVQRCKANERPGIPADLEAHHMLSRQVAAESIVLLRNENAALPLDANVSPRILVVGNGAISPTIQGSGSATTNPYRVDIPFTQICNRAGGNCAIRHLPFDVETTTAAASAIDAVLRAAADSDVVVVFTENEKGRNGEGNDRDTLKLLRGHDDLISALAAAGRRVVAVLSMPDTVEMPWLHEVDAVLACFFPGQGGGEAIARVLFGDQNPCGKLSASMPVRIEDIPGWQTYPGEHGRHVYSEGIFVGYRYYDLKAIAPAFPFGHGLSYTTFSYENMSLDQEKIEPGSRCTATVTIRNTGQVAGKEIVQLYVRPVKPGLKRPIRELKAFSKVHLEPGEAKMVELPLHPRDFQYFDVSHSNWVLDAESFVIEIASSSRDVRLSSSVACERQTFPPKKLSPQSSPSLVFSHPRAENVLKSFLVAKLLLSNEEAVAILDQVRGSFLGFYDTLSWFVGDSVPEAAIAAILEELNEKQHENL